MYVRNRLNCYPIQPITQTITAETISIVGKTIYSFHMNIFYSNNYDESKEFHSEQKRLVILAEIKLYNSYLSSFLKHFSLLPVQLTARGVREERRAAAY